MWQCLSIAEAQRSEGDPKAWRIQSRIDGSLTSNRRNMYPATYLKFIMLGVVGGSMGGVLGGSRGDPGGPGERSQEGPGGSRGS